VIPNELATYTAQDQIRRRPWFNLSRTAVIGERRLMPEAALGSCAFVLTVAAVATAAIFLRKRAKEE
jgi:hypothetical protein